MKGIQIKNLLKKRILIQLCILKIQINLVRVATNANKQTRQTITKRILNMKEKDITQVHQIEMELLARVIMGQEVVQVLQLGNQCLQFRQGLAFLQSQNHNLQF